jgi:methionine sulfoxide reductase heme-binding subunit
MQRACPACFHQLCDALAGICKNGKRDTEERGRVKVLTKRLRTRIYTHHLPLFLLASASTAALYVTRPYRDVITKLSFSTAYPALVLLAATLLIGPWNAFRKQRMPVSSDLRRDIGLWAGIVGIFHAVVGQNVHLRGRPWLYYVYEHSKHGPRGLRHDLFGFNNFTGLAATIVLIVLFATSNDWYLRRLGTRQWKKMQRWNYVCFALTGAHALGFQIMERQATPFFVTALICVAITGVFQFFGFLLYRRGF